MLDNLLYTVVADWKQLMWEKDSINFHVIKERHLEIKNIVFICSNLYIVYVYIIYV